MRSRPLTPLLLLALGGGSTCWGATPFTVVALPDTQYYAQSDTQNDVYFRGQMNWIVANSASRNIVFTMGLGDIQNDGNPYYASTTNWYQPDLTRPTGLVPNERQFENADESVDILDAHNIPYALVPGNHDYLDNTIKLEPIYYLKWFGPQRYAGKPSFGGASPEVPGANPGDPPKSYAGMNTYHFFWGGGRKYMNIGLQFAPDTTDLAWAQSVINANPGVPTIITTHAMLDTDGYQSGRKNIYDQLVRVNPQIVMTMNGHINGAFRLTETNIAGQPVHEMLVDYQSTQFPGYFKGGGYLRTLEFDTDNSVVHVKSYSPIIGNYLTDPLNQFDLALDINGRFGAAPGTPGMTKTRTFQQGKNGYTGTVDTYVDASATTSTSGSTAVGIWADGDAGSASGNQPRQGLVKFDGLIGGANGIPAGAVIVSAKLTLTTSVATDAQTNSTMSLYRVMKNWSNSSTWNSLSSGMAVDGAEMILSANGTVSPTSQGMTVTFDVTESIFAWMSGAPNYGWGIIANGTDGWRFDSAESIAGGGAAPLLEITYFAVPEPAGCVGLVACGMLGKRRR